MQADLNTFLAVASFAITMSVIVFKGGALSRQVSELEKDLSELKLMHTAMASAATIQFQEVRTNISENYMKKPEIGDIERRMESKHGEILKRLDRVDERLESNMNRFIEMVQGHKPQ